MVPPSSLEKCLVHFLYVGLFAFHNSIITEIDYSQNSCNNLPPHAYLIVGDRVARTSKIYRSKSSFKSLSICCEGFKYRNSILLHTPRLASTTSRSHQIQCSTFANVSQNAILLRGFLGLVRVVIVITRILGPCGILFHA